MSSGKSIYKRVGLVVGILFGLFVLVAILVPLFVHVDEYRPQIVQTANGKINGKLELGKLSLSLWGHVRIQADGFTLSDAQGRKIVSAKDVYFHLPFFSLLTGSPVLTFRMLNPEVTLIKDESGKLNLLSLVKTTSGAVTSAPSVPPPAAPSSGGGHSLPGIAVRARFGVELRDALVSYRDEATKLTSDIHDLNIQVKDISLSHPTKLQIWANLDTRMGKTLTVKGPAKITAQAQPKFVGTGFESAAGEFKVDLDGLQIAMPGLLEKKKGIPANIEGKFQYKGKDAALDGLVLHFHNAELKASGTVGMLGTTSAPTIKFAMESNDISLHPWSELVPMLGDYDLAGSASLRADASGTAIAPQYHAKLALSQVTAKAPMLKAQPEINFHVNVVTDQIQEMKLTMKAPGNDLVVTGKVLSFTKPNITILVQSNEMDLDQLIDFPKPAPKSADGKAEKVTQAPAAAGGARKPPAFDVDASLDPLRTNPMLAGTNLNFNFRFNLLKVDQVAMKNMAGQVSFKNLALGLDSFKMQIFKGTIDANMALQLKPRTPSYHFHFGIADLDLQEAAASRLQAFKNTLLGKASFKVDGTGASFNPEPAKYNLDAKGGLSVVQATFATLDIGKMVTDMVSKTMDGLTAKVPQLKGQKVKPAGSIDSKYESITADFTVAKGVFNAPNFYAKADAHGIDLKGDTQVGLKDLSLRATWQVIDTHNMTGAHDLALDQGGVKVEHILAEGNNPVTFPITIGGTLMAPVPSYTAIPEALGKVAMNNVSHGLTNKAKADLLNQAQDQLKKMNAPPAVQNAVQDLGKKLFGH